MRHIRRAPTSAPGRAGTTLTEVLITILIMAIGVVTCATLFPVSVMRSVKATQLTHATILRHNIDSLLEANPDLVLLPESSSGQTHATYSQQNYVVDPLGKQRFNSYTNSTIGDIAPPNGLPRYTTAGAASEQAAADLVTLPDSWVSQYELVPELLGTDTTTGLQYVQFSTTDVNDGRIDLADVRNMATPAASGGQGLEVRIVLFDQSGRLSEVRQVVDTNVDAANRRISISPALPPNGRYATVSNVRIETKDWNYTWLLTVRNSSDTTAVDPLLWTLKAEVDVAVFFRRSFDPLDEQVFNLSGAGDTYTFSWSAGQKPGLKKGGFLLDIDAAKWWRIETVKESGNNATIVINGDPQDAITRAVFMRGVVDVFPIGIKEKS